ncbi:cystinosin-like [Palaemon carinicauda]|uniref:cystinosin-like n=1 Tax=Palaemon carinicauda TaxID=392227 RepID=UPI0035B66D15
MMRGLIFLSSIIAVTIFARDTDGETNTAGSTTPSPLPELSFSTQELDFLIHSTAEVNLTLSREPDACFNVTFSYNKDVLDEVDPIYICKTEEGVFPLSWTVVLNSTKNGKTVFTAEPSNDSAVQYEDLFVRVSVMLDPAINIGADVLGWVYTIAWDVSFLPQIYRNWKRKSVVGLAFDFLTLNFIGFFSYMMYNIGNLWIPEIQNEFHSRHPTSVMQVRLNDVIFPLYALLCTAIQIVQCIFYERDPNQRVSMTCRVISGLLVLSEIIVLIIAASSELLEWLDLLLWFSYVKISITCIKYIPQLYMNYKVKSTEGWSIWQVILDCTGGSLSLVQMFMLAANYDDWHSVLTDPAKLGLGLLSIFFNIFFFMQHCCLYRGAKISQQDQGLKSRKSSASSNSSKSSVELKGIVNPDHEAHL